MITIGRYNPLTSSMREVALANTYLEVYLREHNPTFRGYPLVKVEAGLADKVGDDKTLKAKLPEAQDRLRDILTSGLVWDDVRYVLYMAGSSDSRNAVAVLVNQQLLPGFDAWLRLRHGEDGWSVADSASNNTAAKVGVYRAMSSLSTYRDDEILGDIDIRKVGVFKDISTEVVHDFIEVDDDRKDMLRTVGSTVQKTTDGISFVLVDDAGMTDAERASFDASCESRTIRPYFKGLGVVVRRGAVAKAAQAMGVLPTATTIFGEVVDLTALDMISFGSVFKWSKQVPDLQAWNRFQEGFIANGHRFGACVMDHDARADLPYQQFQTTLANASEVESLAQRSVDLLNSYKKPRNAARLLPRAIGKAMRLYPDLLGDEYVSDLLKDSYVRRLMRVRAGRVPRLARYHFAAPDPAYVLGKELQLSDEELKQFCIPGIEPAKPGKVELGYVVCRKYKTGTKVSITRSPHLDNAHLIRIVINPDDLPEDVRGLYTGNTMYFSAWDCAMTQLQMDYDGDHVCVVDDPEFVLLAARSLVRQGTKPLLYGAAPANPGKVTRKMMTDLVMGMKPAPVGIYAFALAKLWAQGSVDMELDAPLVKACNLCIDAAKNGGVKDSARVSGILKATRSIPLPAFLAYRKAATPEEARKLLDGSKKFGFAPASCVDQYSAYVAARTDEELHVEGEGTYEFRWKTLCDPSAPCKRIDGLAGKNGFFNSLCFDSEAELKMLEAKPKELDLIREEESMRIRRETLQWGAQHGYTPWEILNALVIGVYARKDSTAGTKELKRVLWTAFGDMICLAIQKNLELPEDQRPDDSDDIQEDAGFAMDDAPEFFLSDEDLLAMDPGETDEQDWDLA